MGPDDHFLFSFSRNDPISNIEIDGIRRCIRFYGDEATVLVQDSDEDTHRTLDLKFQTGPGNESRVIDIDGLKIPVPLIGNYTDFTMDGGEIHQIKIGAPSRELLIDGKWYPCNFGDSIDVHIGSRVRQVTLEGPAPLLDVGKIVREDLCLGKTILFTHFAKTHFNLTDFSFQELFNWFWMEILANHS